MANFGGGRNEASECCLVARDKNPRRGLAEALDDAHHTPGADVEASRHAALPHEFGRYTSKADVSHQSHDAAGFMGTRPS